jgi:hypothetical protein
MMFSGQSGHLLMPQPKKDDPDDRNPGPGSLFSMPHPSSLSSLFSGQHPASIFSHPVTSQQQADFLTAISSGAYVI